VEQLLQQRIVSNGSIAKDTFIKMKEIQGKYGKLVRFNHLNSYFVASKARVLIGKSIQ